MGNEVINRKKPWFDLSMSRRTRKAWSSLIKDMHHKDISIQSSQPNTYKEQEQDQEKEQKQKQEEQEQEQEQEQKQKQEEQEQEQEQEQKQEFDRKSLNNLMRCEEESNGGANVNNKSSLGQHFGNGEGIKQTMQLVVKKEKNGVKFKGMMGRYVKVWSGLIKAKRDPKKPVLQFKT